MYCMKCGTEFEADTCPKCGEPAPTSNDFVPPETPTEQTTPAAVEFKPATEVCIKCGGSKFSHHVLAVREPKGCGTYLLCLAVVALFVFAYSSMQAALSIVFGTVVTLPAAIIACILLIFYILRDKTDIHTYAVCENCGRTYIVE